MKQRVKLTICLLLVLLGAELSSAQKPELVLQTGHSSAVTSIAFSPDGQTLVSGSYDKTVQLWDVATGTELRAFIGHDSYVASVAFSPDGKTLASGSYDYTVQIWDVATGAKLRTLKGYAGAVYSVAFSPDGKSLASSSEDGAIKLWSVATGTELRALKGHTGAVTSIAFSPDGQTLASSSEDKTVKLWNVRTGVALRSLAEQRERVKSVAFSPDGKLLASGGWGFDCVKLWDVATGAELRTIKMDYSYVESVAFSLDGQTLAGVSGTTVKLWDVATGAELRMLEGHGDWGKSIAFSPDLKTLAGGIGKDIRLWTVATGVEVRTLKGRGEQINSVVFSPNGKMLARATGDNVKLWDITSGAEHTLKGHTAGVKSVAFSRDGQMLASGSRDRTIKLWNIATGSEVRTLLGHTGRAVPVASESGIPLADALAASVTSVAFSPDGKILASGSQRYVIKLWDVATGAEVRSLGTGNTQSQAGIVNSIAFSPDGKTLASSGEEVLANVQLWDVATGTVRHTLKGHSEYVAFSPDGTLASGSWDNVKLWNVTTGAELRTLPADGVGSAAFSSDGKTLATGGKDNTIKLWDVATGAELRTLKGHSNSVTSVRFSADNKYLVSGSYDASVKVWEVSSGQELASLTALDDQDWVVVTSDGLFDGSPAAWNKILWRFNNNTFDYAPVEAFFREFYYPGLLSDIMAGERPSPPRKDLAAVDIRQPQMRIARIGGKEVSPTAFGQPAKLTGPVGSRQVEVTLEINDNARGASNKAQAKTSGARDVRLFRNGSLVKLWSGDTFGQESTCRQLSVQDVSAPRRSVCNVTVPIVAGENRFTAYAFNSDNVKSNDAIVTVTGAESLKRSGTAYILAVGINKYGNSQYNLKYAVADADDFSKEVKRQQELLKRYAQVEVISLTDAEATKASITQKLAQLAARVQPEDAVIIYFAGHGTAHGKQFYLIPHDLGYMGPRKKLNEAGLQTILAHSHLRPGVGETV